jgi:hypothetical protein
MLLDELDISVTDVAVLCWITWVSSMAILFATMSILAPIQWVLKAHSTGYSGQSIELTYHMYVLVGLEMHKTIPPLLPVSLWYGA